MAKESVIDQALKGRHISARAKPLVGENINSSSVACAFIFTGLHPVLAYFGLSGLKTQ